MRHGRKRKRRIAAQAEIEEAKDSIEEAIKKSYQDGASEWELQAAIQTSLSQQFKVESEVARKQKIKTEAAISVSWAAE